MSSIGIMDPAFFVGKNVLLAWLNDFFHADYSKVEQMSSGAMACQIMDCLYPGKVPLSKVNFDAKTQPEYVANFKVLQSVFDKESIEKHIDVPKLLNGKFQDNLEFLQWLKQYFDKNYDGHEYNAKETRDKARAGYRKARGGAAAPAKPTEAKEAKPSAVKPTVPTKPAATAAKPAAAAVAKPAAAAAKPVAAKPAAAPKPSSKPAGSTPSKASSPMKQPAASAPASAAVASSASSNDVEDAARVAELKAALDSATHETKYYFDKCLEVELLVQDEAVDRDVAELKKAILDILYRGDTGEEPAEEKASSTGVEIDTHHDGAEVTEATVIDDGGEAPAEDGAGLLDEGEIAAGDGGEEQTF